MKTKFKLNQKVEIIGKPRSDGSTDTGVIIGIELCDAELFRRAYSSVKEFQEIFNVVKYKVAYRNAFTSRLIAEWFYEEDLAKSSLIK